MMEYAEGDAFEPFGSSTSDVEASMNDFGTTPTSQTTKKRQQVLRACMACAQAHVKCSEQRPCLRCISHHTECVEKPRQKQKRQKTGAPLLTRSAPTSPPIARRNRSVSSPGIQKKSRKSSQDSFTSPFDVLNEPRARLKQRGVMSEGIQRRPMPLLQSHVSHPNPSFVNTSPSMPYFPHHGLDKTNRTRTPSITVHTFTTHSSRAVDQVPPHFFDEISPHVGRSPMSNLVHQMEDTHFADYTTWDEHGATYPPPNDPFNGASWDAWEHSTHPPPPTNAATLYPVHEDAMDLSVAHISPHHSHPSLPSLPTSPTSSHGTFDPFSQAPPSSSISWFQSNH